MRSTRQDNKTRTTKKENIHKALEDENDEGDVGYGGKVEEEEESEKLCTAKFLSPILYNSLLIVKSVEKFNLIRFVPIEMSPATAIVLTNLRQSMQNNEHKYHAGMPPSTLPHHTRSLSHSPVLMQTNNN